MTFSAALYLSLYVYLYIPRECIPRISHGGKNGLVDPIAERQRQALKIIINVEIRAACVDITAGGPVFLRKAVKASREGSRQVYH